MLPRKVGQNTRKPSPTCVNTTCDSVAASGPANCKEGGILRRAKTWKDSWMGWFLPLGVLAFIAGVGALISALVWNDRRRRNARAMARLSQPLPRVPLRSQVIMLSPDLAECEERENDRESESEALSVHSAPTRELAAYTEELAALSMHSAATCALDAHEAPTRELAAHEAPTREFAAYEEVPLAHQRAAVAVSETVGSPSGFRSRSLTARRRRDDDATLKMGSGNTQRTCDASAEELLRMLGPAPTPDLGNIEIYYRLGLVYLAAAKLVQARRCFLTVEGVSPGYRETTAHLAELPFHAPTTSGATPMHHIEMHADKPGHGRRSSR